MSKSSSTKNVLVTTKTATAKTAKKSVVANTEKVNVVFSFRGTNSIGSTVVKPCGLKQYTDKSHDSTQLILGGKSSLNLRKVTCFVNATATDFELLKSTKKYECVENGNSVDNIRPHKVYFKFDELKNVCSVLATNTANKNGFDIV